MLDGFGEKIMSYVDIQSYADKLKIFGSTQAESAIRTFFPLLKKLGFVQYEDNFPANTCFTKLGTQFVLSYRIIKHSNNGTSYDGEIATIAQRVKVNAQRQGLILMNTKPECQKHNIWVALALLKAFREIHWNEFLYAIYRVHQTKTLNKVIEEIQEKRKEIRGYYFTKENGDALPNTCYSYIKSFLEEASLIHKPSKNNKMESFVTDECDYFFKQIKFIV